MNEQTSGQLRQLLQALGTLATGIGWATTGQVDFWIQVILQIAGPLAMVGGVIWSWKVNTPAALVASVDAMAKDPDSPVKGVIMTNTAEGRELALDVHDAAGPELGNITTVLAGTPDAKAIAATTKEPTL